MLKTVQFIRAGFAEKWRSQDIFSVVQQIQGKVYRHKEGRRTLQFNFEGKSFFLKWHQGVGWSEIVKNIIQLRAPVISAKNEWQAIKFLQQHNIDTLTIAAYGERGFNPAQKQSFLITDDLIDTISLEHIGQQWRQSAPSYATKQCLIKKIAEIAKVMHENGMNHRDFYLCHFLLDKSFAEHNQIKPSTQLFLIDLHRAQLRTSTPQRWIVKDLSGLYFSAFDVALTQRDLLRFMCCYSGLSVRKLLTEHEQQSFWTKVEQRANKMADK